MPYFAARVEQRRADAREIDLGDAAPEDVLAKPAFDAFPGGVEVFKNEVAAVFNRHVSVDDLGALVEAFESGVVIETGESVPSRDHVRWTRETPGLADAVARLGVGESPAGIASAVEFLLEGLHLHRRLNKERAAGTGGGRYRA